MMPSAEGPDRGGDERAVAASERAYRTLIRAYPKALRDEYGEEMVHAFRDLCREESRHRGVRGLTLLWARTLPELVLTAAKERSSMLARNAYLAVRPTVATRWGGLSALLGGSLGIVAYYLGVSVSLQISAGFLLLSVLLSTFGLLGLYGALVAPSGRPGRLAAAGAVLAVASVGSWLAVGAFWLLALSWGWPGGPTHVAAAAGLCSWFVGLLLLGVAALKARLPGQVRLLPLSVAVLVPLSVLLPAFTTLAMPLVISLPFFGMALLGCVLLRSGGADHLDAPSGATERIGRTARRMTKTVARTASDARATRKRATVTEASKERELLEALKRRGELTVARAALETSLTVEESDRMLSALAAQGHLEVRIEGAKMLYSLWPGDE